MYMLRVIEFLRAQHARIAEHYSSRVCVVESTAVDPSMLPLRTQRCSILGAMVTRTSSSIPSGMLISCNRLLVDVLPRPAAPLLPLLREDDLLLLPDDLEMEERDASPCREEEGNLLEPREPCDPRLLNIAADAHYVSMRQQMPVLKAYRHSTPLSSWRRGAPGAV